MREWRIPMSDGDEQDALCPTHIYYYWRAGERKRIKRQYRRRMRREWRGILQRMQLTR